MKRLATHLILALAFPLSIANIAFAGDHNHNLSNNPIGSVLGFPNLEYSYKFADHWTFGILGSSGKVKIGDVEIKGSSHGAVSRYYFAPVFQDDSWYLVGSVTQVDYEGSIDSDGTTYVGKQEGVVVGGGGGYHWFWKSFNMNLGALFTNEQKTELKDPAGNKYKDDVDTSLGLEFDIGWKF